MNGDQVTKSMNVDKMAKKYGQSEKGKSGSSDKKAGMRIKW
jgi:hypothetical protein